MISGEILEVNPVTSLVYTWIVSGTEAITTVTWTLESTSEGTLLNIVHSGIENYPDSAIPKMFDSFSEGWANCMVELTKYLAHAAKPVNE